MLRAEGQGGGGSGALELSVGLKPRPLVLPLAPPVALYGNRVQEGHLGIKFLRIRVNPWERATKCVQLSIACADVDALTQLRDRINAALLRCAKGAPSGPPCGAGAVPARAKGARSAVCGDAATLNRRPLAPRSLNALGGSAPAPSAGASTLRSGPPGGGTLSSALSLGAGGAALAADAESRLRGGAAEELAPLSAEQQRALDLVASGKSIFFTGVCACV